MRKRVKDLICGEYFYLVDANISFQLLKKLSDKSILIFNTLNRVTELKGDELVETYQLNLEIIQEPIVYFSDLKAGDRFRLKDGQHIWTKINFHDSCNYCVNEDFFASWLNDSAEVFRVWNP